MRTGVRANDGRFYRRNRHHTIMRWLVEKPGLALGDKIIGKGGFVPEGVLPQESIDAFVRKGYLALDSSTVVAPDPKPVVQPRGVMQDNIQEIPEMKPEPEKLEGEIEKDEPLPTAKKRTRRKKAVKK